jgi:hypothetical protein
MQTARSRSVSRERRETLAQGSELRVGGFGAPTLPPPTPLPPAIVWDPASSELSNIRALCGGVKLIKVR